MLELCFPCLRWEEGSEERGCCGTGLRSPVPVWGAGLFLHKTLQGTLRALLGPAVPAGLWRGPWWCPRTGLQEGLKAFPTSPTTAGEEDLVLTLCRPHHPHTPLPHLLLGTCAPNRPMPQFPLLYRGVKGFPLLPKRDKALAEAASGSRRRSWAGQRSGTVLQAGPRPVLLASQPGVCIPAVPSPRLLPLESQTRDCRGFDLTINKLKIQV